MAVVCVPAPGVGPQMSVVTPYYQDDAVTIWHGDCREILPTLDPVECCITDPPYGLGFMGKGWDHLPR